MSPDPSLLLSWSAQAQRGLGGVSEVGSLVTGGLSASNAVQTPSDLRDTQVCFLVDEALPEVVGS